MADLNMPWGGDISFTPGGSPQLVDGPDLTVQRIIRRLLTNVGGYVWHREYGAGLPQKIGRAGAPTTIEAMVRANISLEESVAPYPVPTISVVQSATNRGLFLISIGYYNAILGKHTTLSFDTSGQLLPAALLLG